MIRVLPAVPADAGPNLTDGFGRRSQGIDPDTGDGVELLDLPAEWVEHSGFVAALGERVVRVSTVRHASYVHLRRLDRPSADRLVLVSDLTPGWRLSELLTSSAATSTPIDITVVIGLLRQLLPAAALYSRHNRDSAIGTLAPERLIVTPQARLVIAEHAFGAAIEKLNFGRDRLWRDLRVAMPPSTGLPRANARADANAIAVVALSLLVGRLLEVEEYPGRLQSLLEGASERHDGETVPLSPTLAGWLGRALQFDPATAFQSPQDAQIGFESVLASDRGYVTKPAALEQWVAEVGRAIDASRQGNQAPEATDSAPVVVTPAETDAAPLPAPPTAPAHEGIASLARLPLVRALAVIAIVQALGLAWLWNRDPGAPRAGEGELVVQSRPEAARVSVDGDEHGVTPLTITLPSGAHVLEVQIGTSEPRVIPLTIKAGVQTAQYVELQNVAMTGALEVQSTPPGARVSLNGQNRGTAPLTLRDLPPGDHEVQLEADGLSVKHVVRIEPGATAQLVVPMPRP